MPARTGRPPGGDVHQDLRRDSKQEPTRGRSHRMPARATNGLAPCHTRVTMPGNWKALRGARGTRGSEAPLRCSRREHPTARIGPGAGVQTKQHEPLLHAISYTLKRLGIPYQVESGESFTVNRNLRTDIVARSNGLRNAPKRLYWNKSLLLDVTHVAHKHRYPCEEAVLDETGHLSLRARRASVKTTPVRDTC